MSECTGTWGCRDAQVRGVGGESPLNRGAGLRARRTEEAVGQLRSHLAGAQHCVGPCSGQGTALKQEAVQGPRGQQQLLFQHEAQHQGLGGTRHGRVCAFKSPQWVLEEGARLWHRAGALISCEGADKQGRRGSWRRVERCQGGVGLRVPAGSAVWTVLLLGEGLRRGSRARPTRDQGACAHMP